MLAVCKNATPASVRPDKGHTGRSLFELAPLHAPFLTKYLCSHGGGMQSCGSGNMPETKSTQNKTCLSPGIAAKHEDRPWNHLNNGHGKGPGFSRWFTVKRQANKPANKERHRRRYNQQIIAHEEIKLLMQWKLCLVCWCSCVKHSSAPADILSVCTITLMELHLHPTAELEECREEGYNNV